MPPSRLGRLACLCLCVFFAAQTLPARADLADRIAARAPSALVFVLGEDGKALVDRNADRPFVPASVTKIVTAWLALEVLGPDYRFETRFYLSRDRVLHVRGGGDPFLVSEELALLAPALVEAIGEAPIAGIAVDGSYYPDDLAIPGIEVSREAYDALNAAFAVNFNTIHAERRGRRVTSAEPQTPITPLAIAEFRKRGPNGRGRISLAQSDPGIGLRYSGELLGAFIERAGGTVEGAVTLARVPDGLAPIHVHRQSRPLSTVLRLMLLGSNNFVANQIFLEIGAQSRGGQASLDKSLSVARERLAAHDLADAIRLEEGAGLSRGNRFTARGLARLLGLFAPHAELLPQSRGGSRTKTGTMAGIRTLAGYAATSKGPLPFVIALGGTGGRERFRLLRLIEKGV